MRMLRPCICDDSCQPRAHVGLVVIVKVVEELAGEEALIALRTYSACQC